MGEAHTPHPGAGAGGAIERCPASHANPMKDMPAISVKNFIAFFVVILLLLQNLRHLLLFHFKTLRVKIKLSQEHETKVIKVVVQYKPHIL